MLKSRVLSICLGVAALMSMGAVSAVARDAPGNEFSLSEEWKNQSLADLEHNKRYLPGARIRGRFGLVRFELKMNRAGWVLPGTRIVTLDDELGRLALLLLQQSQPFPPPDQVKVPDAGFRMVVPMRFNSPPLSEETIGGPDFERRKLLECYEATSRNWSINVARRRGEGWRLRTLFIACRRDVLRPSVGRASVRAA
jgi:hypothetical protein